jgi:hypothetical protein
MHGSYQAGSLTPKAVDCLIKSMVKKALIQERVHPHVMRHTFDTTPLDNRNDLKTVQTLMGHSHIRTTERYLHSTDDRKVEAIKSLQSGALRSQEVKGYFCGIPSSELGRNRLRSLRRYVLSVAHTPGLKLFWGSISAARKNFGVSRTNPRISAPLPPLTSFYIGGRSSLSIRWRDAF